MAKAILLIVLVIAGTGITMFLAVISYARTPKYNEIMGKISGFKDLQKTAKSRNDAHRGIQILSSVGTRNDIVVSLKRNQVREFFCMHLKYSF